MRGGVHIGIGIWYYISFWEMRQWLNPTMRQYLFLTKLFFTVGVCALAFAGTLLLLSTIGCEERKPNSTSDDLARIGQILEERFPDKPEQTKLISDLVEAINNAGKVSQAPLETTRTEPIFGSFELRLVALLLFSVFLIIVGLGTLTLGDPKLKIIGTVLTITGTLTGLSISSLTLFKIELHPKCSVSVTSQSRFELEYLRPIKSFVTAKHDTCEVPVRDEIKRVVEYINERSKNDDLSYILLVGDADKRLLGAQSKAIYGSNRGLAQTRANWLDSCIREELPPRLNKIPILVVISGPDNIGSFVPAEKLAEDRCVKIYVGWNKSVHADTVTK